MELYLILVLWGISHASAVTQASGVKQDSGLMSVSVGDNVTVRCFYHSNVAMHFSWYQQTLGGAPQLLFSIYKYEQIATPLHQLEKKPRFFVQRDEGVNHLHIYDIQCSDSATYYCGSAHSNVVEFGDGLFLSVKGTNLKQIVQQPVSESVQPGDSVTLNCTVHAETCDGEHNVYWFRRGSGSGSGSGVTFTHEDQCEAISKTESSPQSCVYRLNKKNLSASDTGTYFCAVASCGEILFGNGSKLDFKEGVEDLPTQIQILVLLSITRIGITLLCLTTCILVYVVKTWSTHAEFLLCM